MAETAEQITVLEYGRLEDCIESRLRRRETEFVVGEIATAAEVVEGKAREVLQHFTETHAHFYYAHGDTYRVRIPEERDPTDGAPA